MSERLEDEILVIWALCKSTYLYLTFTFTLTVTPQLMGGYWPSKVKHVEHISTKFVAFDYFHKTMLWHLLLHIHQWMCEICFRLNNLFFYQIHIQTTIHTRLLAIFFCCFRVIIKITGNDNMTNFGHVHWKWNQNYVALKCAVFAKIWVL